MSRDELIRLVVERDGQVAARDAQIAAMAEQLSELMEANEVLASKLARLEYLLSRNRKNSSSPPSCDEDPGRTPPEDTRRRGGEPKRSQGQQPGAPGSNLSWTETPDERTPPVPAGSL